MTLCSKETEFKKFFTKRKRVGRFRLKKKFLVHFVEGTGSFADEHGVTESRVIVVEEDLRKSR